MRGAARPVRPALAAFLPPVPAARLGARPGVHVGRELLLLLQPLLGPGVRRRRLLLRHVLHPGLHGDAPAPGGSKDPRKGEFDTPLQTQSEMYRCEL